MLIKITLKDDKTNVLIEEVSEEELDSFSIKEIVHEISQGGNISNGWVYKSNEYRNIITTFYLDDYLYSRKKN